MKLRDKAAIVTGAGSGFGKETSKLFASEGAKLVCVGRSKDNTQATVDEIKEAGGEAIAVVADVSKEEDVKKFVQAAVDEYGQIDVLFNNAGVYVHGNVEETALEDFQRAMDINVNGVFMAIKEAMPYLKESKGSIINTSSAGGRIGFPSAIGYATSKGAVISLTRSVAVDYAAEGVRCNAICPGTSETGMTKNQLEDEEIKKGFLDPIPMNRLGRVEDVAQAALFLASDDSSYITGHDLPVDGGWTMS